MVASPPVIPILNYTVSVDRGVEIGHYVNLSDVNRELETKRGHPNASERYVAYTAGRLQELLHEYNTHGKEDIARMLEEAQAAKQDGKQKPEVGALVTAPRSRKSARLSKGDDPRPNM